MFWKKRLSEDFVELSIGKVYFKELDRRTFNKINAQSTIANNAINNNIFFDLMERHLVNLSKRKLDRISLVDGKKIRAKLREILLKLDVIRSDSPGKDSEEFSTKDKTWFENVKGERDAKLKELGLII